MEENILCVGESLVRLSTQLGTHFTNTTQLDVHYGGAEANVAVNLSILGHKTTYFTKVADNSLGHSAIQHAQKYGVDTSAVIYGGDRVGLYFLETGAGPRAASVIYDRAHSAFSQIQLADVDVDALLDGKSMLHITGITAAISEEARQLTLALIKTARAKGILINFDVNYRAKLWSIEACGEFVRDVLPYVDYLSAGVLDAVNFIGIEAVDGESLAYYYQKISEMYPNIRAIYATTRKVHSATRNDLQGNLWVDKQLFISKNYSIDYIVDRVGGGDAFAAGVLHGLINNAAPDYVINFATAFSVLKHSIHGDVAPFTIAEAERMMTHNAAVDR
ncbi:sugar kinase [Fundicoccus culcitae]|uniref:Sugar kinase n=1 Tax=Fundicoccus culcitae TaxID=2969821 RepID=A0ABY5P6P9_9LACT|nr:sugar kinase [Fundicoccus culcitae]UUX34407.1 sugar kinase [Fundicoccus culcitae]